MADGAMTAPALTGLNERIAAAFGQGVKSDDVFALIVEAEAALVATGEAVEQTRKRAFDPVLRTNDVAEARRQAEDAEFRYKRLEAAVTQLRERLQQVRAGEEDQRRWAAYNSTKDTRNKLAAE